MKAKVSKCTNSKINNYEYIISIKPQFVDKIRRGEKKFEFRRVLPKHQEVDTIIVYASKPVGKVVGEMIIGDFLTYPTDELWERTKEKSGLTREEFFDYFHGNRMRTP